jgi:hypothetical protein
MKNEQQTSDSIQEYLKLTRETMPLLAKLANSQQETKHTQRWPVTEDHCFQRIVLDNICGGAWYEHIKSPAYQNLSLSQAHAAVQLCKRIIEAKEDLTQLNKRSLSWRKKQYTFEF